MMRRSCCSFALSYCAPLLSCGTCAADRLSGSVNLYFYCSGAAVQLNNAFCKFEHGLYKRIRIISSIIA